MARSRKGGFREASIVATQGDTLQILSGLGADDLVEPHSEALSDLLQRIKTLHSSSGQNLSSLVRLGITAAADCGRAREIYQTLQARLSEAKQTSNMRASHQEKRTLVHKLGITPNRYSLVQLLARSHDGSELNAEIEVVERQRDQNACIPSRHFLVEVQNDIMPPRHAYVGPEAGFEVVEPGRSVIFVSKDANGESQIELACIRGLADSAILDVAQTVVEVACSERRNVRPSHNGAMIQVGINSGPRHATVFGFAKSYTKKLDAETMIEHDEDIIGMTSLLWSVIEAASPIEVVEHVQQRLREIEVPSLATRNVAPGDGFRLTVQGKIYKFPNVHRSPPEVYLSQGYIAWVHTDPAYCTYAFTLCVQRTLEANGQEQPTQEYDTRSSQKRKAKEVFYLEGGGANFVDITLRVLVKQARGTLIIFKPEKPHGTSLACGAKNYSLTVAFSQKTFDAKMAGKVISVAGAGQGNPDA